MKNITNINGSDFSDISNTSNHDEVTILPSDKIISEIHDNHHRVESLWLTMQFKVLEQVTAMDTSQLFKYRCAYDIVDWNLAE